MQPVAQVNKRVSDLDDYNVVAEAGIYYASDKSTLDDAAKTKLNKLAQIAKSTHGYMIKIAGYASKTGSKELNQKFTDAQAQTVADYLREVGNIPMRRILAPTGYGTTHRVSTVSDPHGRAVDRRVDVKVLVNKGLNDQIRATVSVIPAHIHQVSIDHLRGQNEFLLAGERRRTGHWLSSIPSGRAVVMERVTAAGRTNEETMNGVTLAQSPNDPSTSEIQLSSVSNLQEGNHHARNMIILGLALEAAFLATLAVYELSSIFRFQN
jgi:hypothetical protein